MTLDCLTTREIAYLLDSDIRQVNRRAKREGWKSRPRAGRGGGSDWVIASMPKTTRHAIGEGMLSRPFHKEPKPESPCFNELPSPASSSSPAVRAKVTAPVLAKTGHLTEKQRTIMIARKGVLNEIARLATVMSTRNAILAIENGWRDGTLAPELKQKVIAANDKTGSHEGRGVSYATMYRWVKAFEEGGELALAPKHPGPNLSSPDWLPLFLSYWQRPQKPTVVDAYNQFKVVCQGVVPSIYAVRRKLEKMSMPAREYGRRTGNAYLKLRPHKRRNTDELWPTDIYTADGTTFDAEIKHPIHGQPFKPEVTLFVDVATRRCVGLSLGLAESGYVILDALRMACLFGGIPAMLYTDNGSGYCNQMMTAAGSGMMDRLGITMTHSIPGRPQGKGLMERAVQTICEPVSKRFITCSHADMDRDAAKKVFHLTRKEANKSGQSRLMPSWEEFKATMLARIDEYNACPHRGLPKVEDQATGKRRHLTPDEAWQGFVQRGWEPVRVPDEIRSELFMPGLQRQVRNGEVHIFTHSYYADELADFHMQYVEVRYDIWDASRVYCWTTSGEQICTAMLDGNSIPYQTPSRMDAALEKRKAGQLSRAGKKVDAISPGATIQLADSLTHQPEQVVLNVSAEPATGHVEPGKRPVFTSMQARYSWLMQNRERWADVDHDWVAHFVKSDIYADLRPYFAARGLAWDGEDAQETLEPTAPLKRPFFQTEDERYLWLMTNRERWTEKDAPWVERYAQTRMYATRYEHYLSLGLAWMEQAASGE